MPPTRRGSRPLLGRAGFANVEACLLLICDRPRRYPPRDTSRSQSEKSSHFTARKDLACARSRVASGVLLRPFRASCDGMRRHGAAISCIARLPRSGTRIEQPCVLKWRGWRVTSVCGRTSLSASPGRSRRHRTDRSPVHRSPRGEGAVTADDKPGVGHARGVQSRLHGDSCSTSRRPDDAH